MKLQRTLATFSLLACLAAGASVQAADLQGAFNGLYSDTNVTSTKPGRFNGSTRSGWTGGSIDVRFPQATTQKLIAIDPPRLPTAGCGGISAHFGGFSFINGDQIEKMIDNLANGAKGVAINLAIKTLCPMCQNVISEMTNLAQQAAKQSVDACKIGANLATQVLDGNVPEPLKGHEWQGWCADNQTLKGESSDFIASMSDGACRQAKTAMKEVSAAVEGLGGDKDPKAKAGARSRHRLGNLTWNYLATLELPGDTETQHAYRELLLNMMGTKIINPNEESPDVEEIPKPATLTIAMTDGKTGNGSMVTKNMFKLFMCGTQRPAEGSAGASLGLVRYANADNYCGFKPGNPSGGAAAGELQKWYSCPERERCLDMVETTVDSSTLFRSPGFIYNVTDVLFNAVEAVIRDDPNFYAGSEQGKRFIALANMVPFPLYQAVNIAAVEPVGGGSLVQTLSVPIAEAMVMEFFDKIIHEVAGATPMKGVDQKLMENMGGLMAAARNSMDSNKKGIAEAFNLQQAILEQIRVANLSVQREVMTPELLSSGRYANVINTLRQKAEDAAQGPASSGNTGGTTP